VKRIEHNLCPNAFGLLVRYYPQIGNKSCHELKTNNHMPDNLSKTGKPDDSRINIHEEHEVRYWTQKLGVTRERLVQAVKAVGPMVKDVKRHIGL